MIPPEPPGGRRCRERRPAAPAFGYPAGLVEGRPLPAASAAGDDEAQGSSDGPVPPGTPGIRKRTKREPRGRSSELVSKVYSERMSRALSLSPTTNLPFPLSHAARSSSPDARSPSGSRRRFSASTRRSSGTATRRTCRWRPSPGTSFTLWTAFSRVPGCHYGARRRGSMPAAVGATRRLQRLQSARAPEAERDPFFLER